MIGTSVWEAAAKASLRRAQAFNVYQPMLMMANEGVQIEAMDEWCAQAREDYPCMFTCTVEGLGSQHRA